MIASRMKIQALVQALAISSFLLLGSAAWAGSKVKVRLKAKTSTIRLSGFNLKLPTDLIQTRIPQFEKRQVRIKRVEVNQRSFWQIVDSDSQQKFLWPNEVLEIEGEMLQMGPEPLPKKLFLYPIEDQKIDLVAELDIENYLAGVVPSEMPASWPLEALKAQVVASRSYMLSLMEERRNRHFHLEASVFDQVYKHSNRVSVPLNIQNKVLKAIRDTEDHVLLTAGGSIYRSFYHADCGGATEEPEYVWGTKRKNGTVKDASCPSSPQAKWDLHLKREGLRQQLAQHFSWSSADVFRGLLIAQRTPSGRVSQIEIVLGDQTNQKLDAQEFRKLLGYDRLKSTNFNMTWFGDELQIEGQGHGHGVGMCQWGARSMAKLGNSYKDILKRYYPYAEIKKISDQRVPEKLVSR